jgi:hypothetical protein
LEQGVAVIHLKFVISFSGAPYHKRLNGQSDAKSSDSEQFWIRASAAYLSAGFGMA